MGAWDALKELPVAKRTEDQVSTLFKFLKFKDDTLNEMAWCDYLLEVNDEIITCRILRRKAQPLYRGELEIKYGKKGARSFTAKGKWKEVLDEQGYKQYVKVTDADISDNIRMQCFTGPGNFSTSIIQSYMINQQFEAIVYNMKLCMYTYVYWCAMYVGRAYIVYTMCMAMISLCFTQSSIRLYYNNLYVMYYTLLY